VVVAGHRGDSTTARLGLDDAEPIIRASALGALERLGDLDDGTIRRALDDESPVVRRRAAELAAVRPSISMSATLDDIDPTVVEVAAWACGEQIEHGTPADADLIVDRLCALAVEADDPLVREASAAALGAIGDARGVPAILHACSDLPHIRRRAVLALAPFEGPDVDAAVEAALTDRDWQVRQAAEDLRRAAGERAL
jgi:HEAT repeat protein